MPFSISHKPQGSLFHKKPCCWCLGKRGREVSTGGKKHCPERTTAAAARRRAGTETQCSRNWEQKRTEAMQIILPSPQGHPKVDVMTRKPLIKMLKEKSLWKHGAFEDIPFTQKRSLIQFDKYYYVHFQSCGTPSGRSEILFFTWVMCLKMLSKAPSPAGLWGQLTPCQHLGKLPTSQRLWDLPSWSSQHVKPERVGKSFSPGKEPFLTPWCSAHQSRVCLSRWDESCFLAFPG